MRTLDPDESHAELKRDAEQLIERHMKTMPSEQVLAVLSQVVGMVIALQDQRTMRPDEVMQVVSRNIQIGNRSVVDALASTSEETEH